MVQFSGDPKNISTKSSYPKIIFLKNPKKFLKFKILNPTQHHADEAAKALVSMYTHEPSLLHSVISNRLEEQTSSCVSFSDFNILSTWNTEGKKESDCIVYKWLFPVQNAKNLYSFCQTGNRFLKS